MISRFVKRRIKEKIVVVTEVKLSYVQYGFSNNLIIYDDNLIIYDYKLIIYNDN